MNVRKIKQQRDAQAAYVARANAKMQRIDPGARALYASEVKALQRADRRRLSLIKWVIVLGAIAWGFSALHASGVKSMEATQAAYRAHTASSVLVISHFSK